MDAMMVKGANNSYSNPTGASASKVSFQASSVGSVGNGFDASKTRANGVNNSNPSAEIKNTRENGLSNVVSRSKDGDTLQVNSRDQKDSKTTQDGTVTRREDRKAEEEARRAEAERRAAMRRAELREMAMSDGNNQPKVNSFAGYSISEIKQLYTEGRISRQEYEKQMNLKQEALKKSADNSARLNREAAKLNAKETGITQDANAIKIAYGNNSSDTLMRPSDRLEARLYINYIQNTQAQAQAQAQSQQQSVAYNEGLRTWDYQLRA